MSFLNRRWSFAFMSIVAAGLTSLACSAPVPPSDSGGGAAAGSGPPKVNRVVLILNPSAIESNDIRLTCCFDTLPIRPMFEALIGYDAKTGKFIPQLADSWALEPNGESFRFKLHKGVQFNRGFGEFTAKDAVHSFDDLVGAIPKAYSLATWWKNTVKNIEVVNDYEVVYHLNPNSAFIEYISEAGHMMPMRSKAQRDKEGDLGDNPPRPVAGTGAYDFVERQIGSYVRYAKATDNHWRLKPDFPEIEFRWSKEASTRLAALLAGEAHITTLPDDLLPQAERSGMKIVKGQVPGTRAWGTWLCCNRTQDGQYYRDNTTPLLNLKVRQALNKAIDRDALQKAFFARGERMHINQMHQTWPGWDAGWERRFTDLYGFDVEASKKLLAEAGYGPSNPLKTNIAVRPSVVIPNAPDVVEAIAAMWRKAGVEVEMIQTDVPQQTAEMNAFRWTNHMYIDASATHQVSAWPNRTSDLQRHPQRGGTAYFDAETNKIVAALERELDPAKQGALMKEVGELMFTRFGSVPLFFIPVEAVVNPQFVSEWTFPGPSFGTWSHLENIRAVRQ